METIDDDISGRPSVDGRVVAAADAPPINADLQAGAGGSGVIVVNDRDWRSLVWLREQVGSAAIKVAVAQLVGRRRLYVSNMTEALGTVIPSDLALTGANTAWARIVALRSLIKKR